ncbi:hypothetical protein CC77DRAFT_147467 [Alternaria alternata]|uniref:Uncharacterized protein n=1 Tax=Alternaria alternata TaxID=5599 RepID=A0A177DJS4_ALTAL|nr:hypothetical protein CC77DRAFT_147467 [Alternaria alternata]OAG19965.1 hypothetical protein CC77DRAFT_147467 [Alternaria alternata]
MKTCLPTRANPTQSCEFRSTAETQPFCTASWAKKHHGVTVLYSSSHIVYPLVAFDRESGRCTVHIALCQSRYETKRNGTKTNPPPRVNDIPPPQPSCVDSQLPFLLPRTHLLLWTPASAFPSPYFTISRDAYTTQPHSRCWHSDTHTEPNTHTTTNTIQCLVLDIERARGRRRWRLYRKLEQSDWHHHRDNRQCAYIVCAKHAAVRAHPARQGVPGETTGEEEEEEGSRGDG